MMQSMFNDDSSRRYKPIHLVFTLFIVVLSCNELPNVLGVTLTYIL